MSNSKSPHVTAYFNWSTGHAHEPSPLKEMESMLQLKKNLRSTNIQQPLQVTLIELERLRPHEEVDVGHLKELKTEIKSDKILKLAIAIDKDTNIILDGHHRSEALKELRCKTIPAVFVDYNSPQIKVKSWRYYWKVTKEMVIEAGLGNNKLPPNTSKHMIRINGELRHILAIEKKVNFPLKKLRVH